MRKTPAAETFLAAKIKARAEALTAEAEKKVAAEAAAKAVPPAETALAAAQKLAAAAKDEAGKKATAAAVKKATDAKAAVETAAADATKAAEAALTACQAADAELARALSGVEYSKVSGQVKRERLVDELLNRKEFVEMWVMKWAELLTIRTTQQVSYKPMLRYYNWLNERIANNVPIDVMCQELLGANGGTFANAATNYYQNETNTLKVSDVLVGEVWLASGQSNMAMPVRRCRDAKTAQEAANFPKIRMFTVKRSAQLAPQADCQGQWQVCSPKTVGGFSGAAYFFGRRLHAELGVPVGLINSSWGGTAIEAWTSLGVQKQDSRLASVFAPWKNKPAANRNKPANLFNGMIQPLVGYGIRGAIWYQGERNSKSVSSARRYRHQLPLLISDWRKRWGQGGPENFPFFWVQLPNFKARQADPNRVTSWAVMRESMQQVLKPVSYTHLTLPTSDLV